MTLLRLIELNLTKPENNFMMVFAMKKLNGCRDRVRRMKNKPFRGRWILPIHPGNPDNLPFPLKGFLF